MTHPNRRHDEAEREARRRKVAAALLGGVDSLTAISEQMGVSLATISRDVKAIEETWREEAKQDIAAARGRDLKRTERLIASHWPQATKGHLGATDRVIKLMEYRAKLLGTAAPVKQENTHNVTVSQIVADIAEKSGLTEDELIAEATRLMGND